MYNRHGGCSADIHLNEFTAKIEDLVKNSIDLPSHVSVTTLEKPILEVDS